MQTQYGFTLFTLQEFLNWLPTITVARTLTTVQEHHTWSPKYAGFNGTNHFDLQRGMKNYHVGHNGWSDIGQHFTTFPDGTIMTGRPMANAPACILGNNSRMICIENLGDFDTGRDQMTAGHADTIVKATAGLLRRFNLGAPSTQNIVYHHWFDLNTGARTNGTGTTKSCPGTAFFGGNTIDACRTNFLPLVTAALQQVPGGGSVVNAARFASVTANSLVVRTGPATSFPPAGVDPVQLGSILRVYAEQNGWLKVSASQGHWVSSARTVPVTRASVNTDDTNCRTGPGTNFPVVGSMQQGDEVFVFETASGWSKISLGDIWIKSTLLT